LKDDKTVDPGRPEIVDKEAEENCLALHTFEDVLSDVLTDVVEKEEVTNNYSSDLVPYILPQIVRGLISGQVSDIVTVTRVCYTS
jgi:hypothetical protein